LPAASACPDPRRTAATILVRVEAAGAHAARLLGGVPPLVRELVLGTLRWQLTIDTLLAPLLRQPLAELEPVVRVLLRLGTFEAHRLSTPPPVAVSEAVRVARTLAPAASGLVNAVLRRVCTLPWPDPADAALPLYLRFSHPRWLVERWQQRLGGHLEAALAAAQEPAPLFLLAAASHAEELAAAGCELEPHPFVAGVLRVGSGVATAVAALAAGRAYAMDPTAVLVARLLPPCAGVTVELAAAPGGKSLVLALERPDTPRWAFDRHLGRIGLLRRAAALVPSPPRVAAADGNRPPLRPSSCGAVLLDAPCSGTGTLRRHPEIRWRLRPEDLQRHAEQQQHLARAAAELLQPGGLLLYATCSLEAEENEEVLAGLPLAPVELATHLPVGVPAIPTPLGGVILPPGNHGDGFTVHLLQRT